MQLRADNPGAAVATLAAAPWGRAGCIEVLELLACRARRCWGETACPRRTTLSREQIADELHADVADVLRSVEYATHSCDRGSSVRSVRCWCSSASGVAATWRRPSATSSSFRAAAREATSCTDACLVATFPDSPLIQLDEERGRRSQSPARGAVAVERCSTPSSRVATHRRAKFAPLSRRSALMQRSSSAASLRSKGRFRSRRRRRCRCARSHRRRSGSDAGHRGRRRAQRDGGRGRALADARPLGVGGRLRQRRRRPRGAGVRSATEATDPAGCCTRSTSPAWSNSTMRPRTPKARPTRHPHCTGSPDWSPPIVLVVTVEDAVGELLAAAEALRRPSLRGGAERSATRPPDATPATGASRRCRTGRSHCSSQTAALGGHACRHPDSRPAGTRPLSGTRLPRSTVRHSAAGIRRASPKRSRRDTIGRATALLEALTPGGAAADAWGARPATRHGACGLLARGRSTRTKP